MINQKNKYIAIKYVNTKFKFPIKLLCEIANVQRSSYYKWLNKKTTKNFKENELILKTIKEIHEENGSIYGYRRMTLNIADRLGIKVNHKRVYRIMKENNLLSVIRRRRKYFYRKTTQQHVSENILNRKFYANKPNEKWLTDVTEFKYGVNKKAYLSAIIDLYDNSIVAYTVGHSNNNKLVFENLDLALKELNGEKPLIHSDRGFQYTSHGFFWKINKYGLTHSMSRVGRCLDNAPMEGFFGILKSEKYYLNKYKDYDILKRDIENYINFYNNDRLQKKLDAKSPLAFRYS